MAEPPGKALSRPVRAVDAALLEELWRECEATRWGLTQAEFEEIVCAAGAVANFGLGAQQSATRKQQAEYFGGLRLDGLVLARACAAGNERAWEQFMAVFREPISRAAIAISGSQTLGREMADQLYGELYGLTTRDGERRCPLASYRGRGSLMGWLRTTLAQRHVDHHRQTRREAALDDADPAAPEAEAAPVPAEIQALEQAIESALRGRDAEERFLLAGYYLDGQTLSEIARVLGVHEATASRKLHRALDQIRKQVLRHLERQGLSRRAAREALGTDPRDLDVNLKKLLQQVQNETFQEKAAR